MSLPTKDAEWVKVNMTEYEELKENRVAPNFVQRFYNVQEQGGATPDLRTGHRKESYGEGAGHVRTA